MKFEGQLVERKHAEDVIKKMLEYLPENALISFTIEAECEVSESDYKEVEEIHKKMDKIVKKETEKITREENEIWINKLGDYCEKVQCIDCDFFNGCTEIQNIAVTTSSPCFFSEKDKNALLEATKNYSLENEIGKIPEIKEEC